MIFYKIQTHVYKILSKPKTIFYAPFQYLHGQQAESKISEAKAKFYFDLREVKSL